jgi:hypothetical protein
MELTGIEGLLMTLGLLMLPFVVLAILLKIFPAWEWPKKHAAVEPAM